MSHPKRVFAASLVVGALLGACVDQSQVRQDGAPAGGRASAADDLLIVDCLLPGQIRKLGTQMTYLSARRPIQTTAQDCSIRGGEYVAYDRANYANALQIWLPLAQQGDPDAQNKLGEIYEKGLGGPPDYEAAALWYRRAADQGFNRAQINLAFLYEKGLGVPKDLKAALGWYRKASNLPDAVVMDKADLDASRRELDGLRQSLAGTRAELERARKELDRREGQLRQERERLRREAPAGGGEGAERVRKLEQEMERQRQELAQRRQQVQELEGQSQRQQARLLTLQTEGASLRDQLALVRTELGRTNEDLGLYRHRADQAAKDLEKARADLKTQAGDRNAAADARIRELESQLDRRERLTAEQQGQVAALEAETQRLKGTLAQTDTAKSAELSALQARLDQARSQLGVEQEQAAAAARQLDKAQAELAAQSARNQAEGERVRELEARLAEREKVLADNREAVQRLEQQSADWKRKLAELEKQGAKGGTAEVARTTSADVPLAPPSIQLIEPPLVAVRSGESRIPVKRGLKSRTLIGQVNSSAGLYALTVNGANASTDDKGLFKTDVPIQSDATPVNIVAIDQRGKRATLAFELVIDGDTDSTLAKRTSPVEGVEIGKYYALVIGNQDYQTLPDLDTSRNDAQKVADLLEKRFGFQVTLLLDADRYRILSEMNRLRQQLTDQDNLVLYYAGHGELDRANLRGHWLPVDAEVGSTANWISNVAVTDILNAMSVRHVLVVADSCYSGALTRSSLANIEAGKSDDTRNHWLRTIAKMRSRTVLTSGGLAPVLDGGGGAHSVFAKAFIGVLNDLDDVAEGQRVFREVASRVTFEANKFQVEQVPEYAPIKFAGHESGDFLFVPKELL